MIQPNPNSSNQTSNIKLLFLSTDTNANNLVRHSNNELSNSPLTMPLTTNTLAPSLLSPRMQATMYEYRRRVIICTSKLMIT